MCCVEQEQLETSKQRKSQDAGGSKGVGAGGGVKIGLNKECVAWHVMSGRDDSPPDTKGMISLGLSLNQLVAAVC